MSKDVLYMTHVRPVIDQLIATCREHGLNFAVQVSTGDDIRCSSQGTCDREDGLGHAMILAVKDGLGKLAAVAMLAAIESVINAECKESTESGETSDASN